MKWLIALLIYIPLLAASVGAQSRGATITRTTAGYVQVNLGYGVFLNKDSSLQVEWTTVHHSDFPADLEGNVGIGVTYHQDRVRGGYRYRTSFTLDVKEPLVAVEVRFLVFDVWGRHAKTLSYSRVIDLEPGRRGLGDGEWNILTENEAAEFYASISYIAKVRTKSGRIVAADTKPVLEEAKKLSSKFTEEDLEPKRPPGRDI